MTFLHLFIVNKSGGLIYFAPLSSKAPTISTNEWLRIGSTFHSLHAIAAEASPVKLTRRNGKNASKYCTDFRSSLTFLLVPFSRWTVLFGPRPPGCPYSNCETRGYQWGPTMASKKSLRARWYFGVYKQGLESSLSSQRSEHHLLNKPVVETVEIALQLMSWKLYYGKFTSFTQTVCWKIPSMS